MDDLQPPQDRVRSPSRRFFIVLALVGAVASGVAAYSWSQRSPVMPAPTPINLQDLGAADLGAADPAPDFTVPTLDGSLFSLSSHLETVGTPVVLNLWASWCGPCRSEMPAIDAVAARHPNVKFVGVAVQDDNTAAADFATELGVGYTIGLDERDEVNALYPSFGLPVTYVISAEGTILQPIYGELMEEQLEAMLSTWFGG